MSLDHEEREPVYPVTGSRAIKLINHDGSAMIALEIFTTEGTKRFFLQEEDTPQFITNIQDAIASPGLKPLV